MFLPSALELMLVDFLHSWPVLAPICKDVRAGDHQLVYMWHGIKEHNFKRGNAILSQKVGAQNSCFTVLLSFLFFPKTVWMWDEARASVHLLPQELSVICLSPLILGFVQTKVKNIDQFWGDFQIFKCMELWIRTSQNEMRISLRCNRQPI